LQALNVTAATSDSIPIIHLFFGMAFSFFPRLSVVTLPLNFAYCVQES